MSTRIIIASQLLVVPAAHARRWTIRRRLIDFNRRDKVDPRHHTGVMPWDRMREVLHP